MAYKKYIKRKGKVYGPYIYHSRKVKGKVITEYRGKHQPKKEKNNKDLVILLSLIAAFFIIFALSNFTKMTGFSVSEELEKQELEELAFIDFVIELTDAKHLDSNKNFISNIFEKVKELDDIWSEQISDSEYLRITFEENLTSENDITIYPRIISGTPKIEVYEVDENSIIAQFTSLNSNEYNKVLLTNLVGEQDVFDLLVLGGSLIIDYIIDPTQLFYEDWETGIGSDWDNIRWDIAVDYDGNTGNSIICPENGECTVTSTVSVDTSNSESVNVSFTYNDDDCDAADLINWYWNDTYGTWNLIGTTIDAGTLGQVDDAWFFHSAESSDPKYQHVGFAVRFHGIPGNNENYWVDNINISHEPAEPTDNSPTVTLNSPIDYYNTTEAITFNCTASDDINLVNVSLYGNWTTGWHLNETNTPANNTPTTFVKTINEGYYVWNCQACDNATTTQCSFADDNRTFTVDTTAPSVSTTSVNDTSVSPSQKICINATVTDSGIGIDKVWAYITYPNATQANITMTDTGSGCGGGVDNWYGVDINVGSTQGTLTANTTYANDTLGNLGNESSWPNLQVTVSDNPPKYYTPSENDSTPNPTEAVRHNVYWQDDTELSYATLEVNSSGVNCDTTDNVSSTSLNQANEWANLTWIVPNACEGKVIGWRQYTNDSLNQWNGSMPLQTYTVENIDPTASFGTTPIDTYNSTSQSVTFELSCSDNLDTSALILYGNWTGTWHANQTNTSAINNSMWSIQVDGIPEGTGHVWGVWCNDSLNNEDWTNTNRTFKVDATAPSLNNEASNETEINQNEVFCLNITATDSLSDISMVYAEVWNTDSWANYTMAENGTSCDGDPSDGVYGVEIVGSNVGLWNYSKAYANDSLGNMKSYDFSDLTINVTAPADSNYPQFSDFTVYPNNNTPYSPSALNYKFNSTITFTNSTAGIDFGGTNYSSTNVSDAHTVSIPSLAAGIYDYFWWSFGNGSNKNPNSSSVMTYSVAKSSDSCSIYFNESSPLEYPGTFLVWTNCTSSYTMYKNGSSIENNSKQVLGAGAYNFTVMRDDAVNYSNYYDEEEFQITKSSDSCSIYFNESSPLTYPGTFLVWTNCTSSYNMYMNGSAISNNTEHVLGVGAYNFSVLRTDSSNYTNYYHEQEFQISKATPTMNYYLNGVQNNASLNYPNTINASASATAGTINIYRNGTEIISENNLDIALAAGYYEYVFNVTGDANYSDVSSEYLYTEINKSDSNCQILFNETSPLFYESSFRVYTDCDPSFTLYRNGTIISNNSEQQLAASAYNFSVLRTDASNYTNYYHEQEFRINKTIGEIATHIDGVRGDKPVLLNTKKWLNATLITGHTGSIITLYYNNTLKEQGPSPLYNLTNFSSEGIFNVSAIYDGNENYTSDIETWWVTVSTDSPPTINIVYPENIIYNIDVTILNYTVDDDINLSHCWYSLNNGTTNSSFDSTCANATGLTADEGSNTWTVYANDSIGQESLDFVTFTKDTIYPNFTSYDRNPPTPNETQDVQVNVTITETNIDKVILEWNSTANYTVTTSDGNEYYFTVLQGNYTAHNLTTYYWYANDTAGNMNKSAQQSFTVANQFPSVSAPGVNNTTPYTNDLISCNGGSFSDNDGDPEQARYFKWYNNYVEISGQTSQTLDLSEGGLDKGDIINCSVRVYDGYDNSSWTNSSNTSTIQNSAPTIDNPQASVSWDANGSTYYHDYNATDLDEDGFTWYINTSLIDINPSTGNVSDIPTEAEAGTYAIEINVSDGTVNATDIFNYTINDVTNPSLTISLPETTIYSTNESLLLNYTASDASLDSCWYNINLGANTTISSCANTTFNTSGSGSFTLYLYANDSAGNINNTETVTFEVDLTNPTASFGTNPVNNSNESSQSVTFELSCSDNLGTSTLILYGNWTGTWHANQTNTSAINNSMWSIQVDGIPEGTGHVWGVWCNDSVDNSDWSINRTFNIDLTFPLIDITNPTATNYTTNISELNYTFTETNVDKCWHSINNGTTNSSTQTCGTNWTDLISSEGSNTWTVYINDTSGNENSSSITFFKDTIAPYFTTLTNQTSAVNQSFSYDVDATDDGIGIDAFNLNDTSNFTIDSTTGVISNITSLTEEVLYTLNLSVNDSLGNLNWSIFTINITLDSTNPQVSINSPTATTYSISLITFNITATDNVGIISCWYSIDSWGTNTTLDNLASNFYSKTATLPNAAYIALFWCNDTSGNLNNTENVSFTVSVSVGEPPGGGGGGIDYECTQDSDCGEYEVCLEHICIKPFDIKIIDFESPAKLGEFFDFTYLIKGMADINNDVEVSFWIEREKETITSGSDVIYLGSFEEKIETTKIFLPSTVNSGVYQFFVQVSYENYTVQSHRTIEIEVKDGLAEITPIDKEPSKNYLYYLLGILALAILIVLIKIIRRINWQGLSINLGRRVSRYRLPRYKLPSIEYTKIQRRTKLRKKLKKIIKSVKISTGNLIGYLNNYTKLFKFKIKKKPKKRYKPKRLLEKLEVPKPEIKHEPKIPEHLRILKKKYAEEIVEETKKEPEKLPTAIKPTQPIIKPKEPLYKPVVREEMQKPQDIFKEPQPFKSPKEKLTNEESAEEKPTEDTAQDIIKNIVKKEKSEEGKF